MIWIKSYIRISFVDWPKFWNFCFSEIVLGTYQVLKIHTNKYGKSLLNCMPYVLKVCSHALRVYVLTCQHVLHAYMLSCQRVLQAHVPYVLTCQHPLRAHALMSLAYLHTHMPMCLAYLHAHMPMCLMCFCAPGKNLGKFTIYFGIEVIHRLFLTCFFIFTSFNTAALILLVKILNSKLQISEMWLIQLG